MADDQNLPNTTGAESLDAKEARGPEYALRKRKSHYDFCNICCQVLKLTDDHVPPRSATIVAEMEVKSMRQIIARDNKRFKSTFLQNGLQFRTICGRCNSKMGLEYDPELVRFCSAIRQAANSVLALPRTIDIPVNPDRIMLSIIGHLLAGKITYNGTVWPDRVLRDFFHNPGPALPDGLNIFYWFYPFDETMVIRDVMMPSVRGRFDKTASFSILKFYPIAFLIADCNEYEGLRNLSRFATGNGADQVNVPIDLVGIRDAGWPETPDDGNWLLTGPSFAESVRASARSKGRIFRPYLK